MLNELLPLLHGPPRKSFRSYGRPEASVPVKSAGMRKMLREGKRVREGPGTHQGGRGPARGMNARPGRESYVEPRVPNSESAIPNPGPGLTSAAATARARALQPAPRDWPVRTRVALRPRRAARARCRGACREL